MVQKEEAEAAVKARETLAIADDAQRDLNEALPALVSSNRPSISQLVGHTWLMCLRQFDMQSCIPEVCQDVMTMGLNA